MSRSPCDPQNLPRRGPVGGVVVYATHGNEFSSDVGIERSYHFKTMFQVWDGSAV
jgi:hypothetical protein